MLVAIINSTKSQNTIIYDVVTLDENSFNITGRSNMSEPDLINALMSGDYFPVNFSVDASRKIVQNQGSFDRLKKSVGVVVGIIKSPGNKTAYMIVGSNANQCFMMTMDDVIQLQTRNNLEYPVQNMMLRNGVLSTYPDSQIPTIALKRQRTIHHVQPNYKVKKDGEKLEKKYANTETASIPEPKTKPNIDKSLFSKEQLREIKIAEHESPGISYLINDPSLSPKQMRIIWSAKRNGIKSECFANNAYSVNAMKFYADRLYSDTQVERYKPALSNPSLTLKQLMKIDEFIDKGYDYSKVMDDIDNPIAVQMVLDNERQKAIRDDYKRGITPEKKKTIDAYIQKCMNVLASISEASDDAKAAAGV